jgi:hypothetical protein
MRMNRKSLSSSSVRTALVLTFFVLTQAAVAQSPNPIRPGDKELESLMNNLNDEAKAFRPRFDSEIRKSAIRKTSKAKDALNLASSFQQQTAALLNEFKKTQKGSSVPSVLSTADQIEKLIDDLKLDPQALGWDKMRADLNQLSNAFNIAPAAADGDGQNTVPCIKAVGAERSKKLVDECLQVSPATHPPCNSQNSCDLIIDEIKRSCALLGASQPSFCGEYK